MGIIPLDKMGAYTTTAEVRILYPKTSLRNSGYQRIVRVIKDNDCAHLYRGVWLKVFGIRERGNPLFYKYPAVAQTRYFSNFFNWLFNG